MYGSASFSSGPPRNLGQTLQALPRGRTALQTSNAILAAYRPYFWNSQSLLSRGQTWRVFSHREMQWKWKACCEQGKVLAQC